MKRFRSSNQIPESIQQVPGMPKHVVVYRVECSPCYWTRFYVNGRYRIRSTETENKKIAYEVAKTLFMEALRSDEPRHILKPKTFAAAAIFLLNREWEASKCFFASLPKEILASHLLLRKCWTHLRHPPQSNLEKISPQRA